MSEAIATGVAGEAEEARRPTVANAGLVVLAAGALGVIGQLLFFDVGLGINFPIAIGLLLAGGWLLRRPSTEMDARDAWLGPAAVVFAAFAAIRADPTLVALDVLTSLGLTGGALAAFAGRAVVASSLGRLLELALRALGWAATGAIPALGDARHELPSARAARRRAAPVMPVLRGLAIALPLVIVFVVLFAAADAVFARLVDDLFGFEIDLGDGLWRLVMAAALAWFAAGSIGLAASTPTLEGAEAVGRRWHFGTVEIVTVLVAVNAVFVLFVVLQGAYLFGGLDTMQAAGMTYAEYARRGFFELVAVSLLAGVLVVASERLARERTRTMLVAAAGLTVLTGVVLASALLRLRLYQDAYGWTELRFYVLATIGWLAIGLVALLVALLRDRVRWIVHALIAAGLVVGLILNVIGPVRFITEQNVARVLDPRLVPPNGEPGLDVWYGASLGDDAVPELVRALPALEPDAAEYLGTMLGFRDDELRLSPGLNAWQAWNAGRAAARDALAAAAARGELR